MKQRCERDSGRMLIYGKETRNEAALGYAAEKQCAVGAAAEKTDTQT